MNPGDDPAFLRDRLESKKRHARQSKAMCLLTENDNKKLVAENKRLKLEVAELKQKLASVSPANKEVMSPITPKQALVRAGLFNVEHNDVLQFTPLLLTAYAHATGGKTAIEREGLKRCFPKEDLELVVRLIIELAPVHLEKYWRIRCKAMAAQKPLPPPS
jgi:hypothetical protein